VAAPINSGPAATLGRALGGIVENIATIDVELVPAPGYTIAGVTKATIPIFNKEK
jgi:hypothetical protein